ncbi:disA bacterial checkpoint controller nucleotide-binding domain-containing protein [Ditylenchus destructor]|nr:disA bacterial checkpoint controller nucleotide-binding domain-containing protein [Ditylenchus destructor]
MSRSISFSIFLLSILTHCHCQFANVTADWCSVLGGKCFDAKESTNICLNTGLLVAHKRCARNSTCCIPSNEMGCRDLGGQCRYVSTCNPITSIRGVRLCPAHNIDIICCLPKTDPVFRLVIDFLVSSLVCLLCVTILAAIVHKINSSYKRNLLDENDAFIGGDWLPKFIDEFVASIYRMADKKIGALVIIQHKEDLDLDNLSTRSTCIDARWKSQLLECIFHTGTTLHDGAVVIKLTESAFIHAAKVILPIDPDTSQTLEALHPNMGTRHRAAMGHSFKYRHSLVVVVSEETREIAVFNEEIKGGIQENIKPRVLTALMRDRFIIHTQSATSECVAPNAFNHTANNGVNNGAFEADTQQIGPETV